VSSRYIRFWLRRQGAETAPALDDNAWGKIARGGISSQPYVCHVLEKLTADEGEIVLQRGQYPLMLCSRMKFWMRGLPPLDRRMFSSTPMCRSDRKDGRHLSNEVSEIHRCSLE